MGMQNFFVLTSAQRTTSVQGGIGWGDGEVAIDPRAVDNTSPGVGLSLNDNAADYDPAEPVTLTGCYVAPKRIVDDAEYLAYAPAMVAVLLTLPWCSFGNGDDLRPNMNRQLGSPAVEQNVHKALQSRVKQSV